MAKVFITGGRPAKIKNWSRLQKIFAELNLPLEILHLPHQQFLARLKDGAALVLISLSEVSPNLVLDALKLGKPVILTQETGLRERLGQSVLWVDPQNEQEIKEKVLWLLDENNYQIAGERARQFKFTHSWSEIADEFLAVANKKS